MTLKNEFERKTKQPLTAEDLIFINSARSFLVRYNAFKTKEIVYTNEINFADLKEVLTKVIALKPIAEVKPTKLTINKFELEYAFEPNEFLAETEITDIKLFDLMVAIANDIKTCKLTTEKRIEKELKPNKIKHLENMIWLTKIIDKQRKEMK